MSTIDYLLFLLVVLGLMAEHYFPYWWKLTGRKLPDPVRLIVNYTSGTLAWFGAFSLWLVMHGQGKIALIGWGFALVAGITVIGLYAYDARVSNQQDVKDRLEVLELMERQENAAGKRS